MRSLLVPLLCSACAPAVEAPVDVADMMVFGFVGFEEPDHLEALVGPLFSWVDGATEQLDEDGYAVTSLGVEDLAAVGVSSADVTGVIGALGTARYVIGLDEVAAGITHPHKDEIYEGTTAWTVTAEDGDRDCFLRRACDHYAFVADEENRVPVLGASWKTTDAQVRWVQPEEGGAAVLALRQLTPDPIEFASPILAIDQQYGFTMLREEPDGGVLRVEAFWVDARVLNLELPEGFAVAQAVRRMQASAADMDAYFLGVAGD